MGIMGKHGVSTDTPQNILLGAGTIHKDLMWNAQKKQWEGSIIGATSGGNKLSIKGEIIDIEIDGVLVKLKGFAVKQGGTAIMDVNFAEIKSEILQMVTLFAAGDSEAEGYTMLTDKANITEGDYVPNFAFVGKTADGAKDIIVIFENALCTSGLEIEGKNKDKSVIKATMEAYADNEGELDTLPVKIYYPDTLVA